MDLQQTEKISKDEGKRPEILQEVDGSDVRSQNQEQASVQSISGPGLPNLSRCAACYSQKNNFLSGGDGESSSSAGDSGPEEDSESEAESVSSSSSSSVEEDEPEKPPSPAGSEDGGKDDEEEVEGTLSEGLAEGTVQTDPQSAPTSSVPQLRAPPCPDTVVSTLHLLVLPQEDASDTFYIIRQYEEDAEEQGGERGGACHLPPQTGCSHPPSQQHQLPHHHHHHHHHPHAYQMLPQHFPLLPVRGQRLPPALHPPWPALHTWPQAPAPAHLEAQVPHRCWCCSNRGVSQKKYPH